MSQGCISRLAHFVISRQFLTNVLLGVWNERKFFLSICIVHIFLYRAGSDFDMSRISNLLTNLGLCRTISMPCLWQKAVDDISVVLYESSFNKRKTWVGSMKLTRVLC